MKKRIGILLIALAMEFCFFGADRVIAAEHVNEVNMVTAAIIAAQITPTTSSTGTVGTANLIPNPALALDTVTKGTPDNWLSGWYGSTTPTFTYPVTSWACSGTGAEVSFATPSTDGNAKWYPNPAEVPVSPNTGYVFSDLYSATAASDVTVGFLAADKQTQVGTFIQIAAPPATVGNACGTASGSFTTPAGAEFAYVFHETASGSLTITNASLTALTLSGSATFSKGIVSLRHDDGWLSQLNTLPILQKAGLKGSYYIISDMLASGQTIYPSANNTTANVTVTTTSKSVTWSGIYTDPSEQEFTFQVGKYSSSATATVTVTYTAASNNASASLVAGTLPAGTNVSGMVTFTVPVLAPSTPINIKLSSTGTMTASEPLLTETIGYMNATQVLSLQSAGMEIGDHTLDHCDLLTLLANPSSATIPPTQTGAGCPDTGPLSAASTPTQQIDNARTALLAIGAAPVSTFAYPYGAGAGNATIEGIVKADGMIAASSVNAGYNTKVTDPFNLNVQIVDITVTNPATVTAWIDYAATNKVWLILLFHQVETSETTLTQNGETDGTTTAIYQAIVTYAQQQVVAGKIVVDTVGNVMTKYFNQ